MSARDAPFAAAALRLSAGIIIWALHFGAIYGYTGLACARRFHAQGETLVAAIPWVIGISTIVAAAAAVPFIARFQPARGGESFIGWMSAALAALALAAIVLEGLTFLWLPACA